LRITLAADLIEVVTENAMHLASVRFAGLTKDDGETVAVPFEEVWNMKKPVPGGAGWMLAGIQQVAATLSGSRKNKGRPEFRGGFFVWGSPPYLYLRTDSAMIGHSEANGRGICFCLDSKADSSLRSA